MGIIRLAGEIFLIYILYKLIFDFIIPVYNTTKTVKKQFTEMHSKMQEQVNKMNSGTTAGGTAASQPSATPTPKAEDYIEYEEVK
jgi:hypothetical protein